MSHARDIKLFKGSFVKAMACYDASKYEDPAILERWNWATKCAIVHPNEFRDSKSNVLHGINLAKDANEWTRKIYKEMEQWEQDYGRNSMLFNTMIRSISVAKFSKRQVENIRKKDGSRPPAFDDNYGVKQTSQLKQLRIELEEWVKSTSDTHIQEIRKVFKREINKLKDKEPETIILTNGTTTCLQWRDVNITDIMSIVYCPEDFYDRFSGLCEYFKVENKYSHDEDDYFYITIPKCNRYTNNGGDHLVLPDKDGKIREVYRMYPWVQVPSKGVHSFMDRIVRNLEGNYTYNHRDWLRNIVKKRWHIDKYIIGTDMTKYSDTLHRSFIMFLLEEFGLPRWVVKRIDELYSMGIFDELLITEYKDTKATYQGQYGDFPFITLANLVLQAFVYHKAKQACKEGYKAAVGDDTGMVFDRYDVSIRNIIRDVYGCVGVDINEDKTSELIMGQGRIEFVKLELCKDGIVNFLNTRSIHNNNIDAVIRDIYDLEFTSDQVKRDMFEQIFGKVAADRLMELSIINGGISNHPITIHDLQIYLNRSLQLTKLLGYSEDETKRWLDKLEAYLRDELDEPKELCNTALLGYLTKEEVYEIIENDTRDINEEIKMRVLNMTRFGLTVGVTRDIKGLLGQVPNDLREEWKKKDWDETKDWDKANMWENIQAYETYAAQRRIKEEASNRKMSVMLPVILGMYDYVENRRLPDQVFYIEKAFSSVDEYISSIPYYKVLRNYFAIQQILQSVGNMYTEVYYGKYYDYIDINTDHGIITRRCYSVKYDSKYSPITKSDYDLYLSAYLKPLDISYEELMLTWSMSDKIHFKDLPLIDEYGRIHM